MRTAILASTVVSIMWGAQSMSLANDASDIPVAAPIDSESTAKGGEVAIQSVMRVQCPKQNSAGTGFVHKSGKLITAEHVVRNCSEVTIILGDASTVEASVEATDPDFDVALLNPKTPIGTRPLQISSKPVIKIGTQVSTWGFPSGYSGLRPMLSVGYLSGIDGRQTKSGKVVGQWVVNAAFNSGNSGGPLLEIETGEVIGVVSSKLAQISNEAMTALQALQNQRSGFVYNATRADGSKFTVSEGQIVAMVLDDLRRQVQLVIGKAVLSGDLRVFLTAHGVDP